MYDEFFNLLKNLIEKGISCPLHAYRSLKEDPRYILLKEKNDFLMAEAQKKAKFEYIVHVPDYYSKDKEYPVFFNLHGDGDNIEYHKQYWKPDKLLKMGFIVVYVQSSQTLYHNEYIWLNKEIYLKDDDMSLSERIHNGKCEIYNKVYDEVMTCYNSISNDYSINHDKIIIGGFSGGAIASIDIALSDIIPIKGVVALCSVRPKRFNLDNIKLNREKGLKFVFMEGEKDIPEQDIEQMIEGCKKLDIPFEYYINKNIGHWYPEDLDYKLDKALNFILK